MSANKTGENHAGWAGLCLCAEVPLQSLLVLVLFVAGKVDLDGAAPVDAAQAVRGDHALGHLVLVACLDHICAGPASAAAGRGGRAACRRTGCIDEEHVRDLVAEAGEDAARNVVEQVDVNVNLVVSRALRGRRACMRERLVSERRARGRAWRAPATSGAAAA